MFPVAIQVYSVRDDAAADMMGTLKKIADMGYDGVEFAGFYGYGAEEIRAELDKLGLKAVSSHVPFATLRSDLEATAEYHKILGCKYIAVPYLEEKDRPGTENWQKTIDDILAIGKYLHSPGIQLLYHNTTSSSSRSTASTRWTCCTTRCLPSTSRPNWTPAG